uniref:RXYLT1 C-terminal domain-containing protein n=1 Tax=Compsopogon caeruleus TaxID=31354 RepID=A0A7S1T9J1_9RHOD|mmetsp:Transcript_13682/g.28046  ORF Transcript_13682/g.28046 Transcript_13682/m.28046 type:complete len:421 (+) Transcript_13682:102-1364(+)
MLTKQSLGFEDADHSMSQAHKRSLFHHGNTPHRYILAFVVLLICSVILIFQFGDLSRLRRSGGDNVSLVTKETSPVRRRVRIVGTGSRKFPISLLYSRQIERFGTGQIEYRFDDLMPLNDAVWLRMESDEICIVSVIMGAFQLYIDRVSQNSTALLAEYIKARQSRRPNTMSSNVGNCLIWVAGDEFCQSPLWLLQLSDFRFYQSKAFSTYSAEQLPHPPLVLPLGPRIDVWEFLEPSAKRAPKPMEKRKFLFNAIFSASTSPGRIMLQGLLTNSSEFVGRYQNESFVQIMTHFDSHGNAPGYINASTYASVLGDSKFTLSPFGHNPECFRLYEAIEAGSIPITIIDDDEYVDGACQDPLADFRGSPIIMLPSWAALPDFLESEASRDDKLGEVQKALTTWYHSMMKTAMQKLEDRILSL